ncbi:MAG: S53 family peptidase [Candidatus Tumulicola sp.]
MHRESLRRILRRFAMLAVMALVPACAADGARPPATISEDGARGSLVAGSAAALPFVLPANVRRVCPDTGDPKVAHCESLLRLDVRSTAPAGYGPSDLQSAYNLPSATNGKGQTVAIVDAFDDPNVEADLFVYRNTFGLPVCSTLNGCFTRVNQEGKAHTYPRPNANWAIETSLDLDMVSAACPNCNILLVEAKTNSWANLEASVNEAVALGAHVISNSYGAIGGANPADYDHAGVMILASGGDDGYYAHHDQEPADFPTVVAVGGTSLTRGGGARGWSETVWSGSGSGCSKLAKPSWQHDTGCKHRTANDVAAVANPQTGVAVYDSYQQSGWLVIGGTSAGSPINAAVFALAGNASQLNAAASFYQVGNQQYLNDVTTGENGTCSPKYLCTGEVGYDGPTGWGTPNGIGAY